MIDYLNNNLVSNILETIKHESGIIHYQSKEGKQLLLMHGVLLAKDQQMQCIKCGKSVIGDPKYHQVYEKGLLVGHRHRNCI